MAKKLNKNLVAGLAGVGFVLTTVVGVLLISQIKETDPEEFAKRAEEAVAIQEWKRAETFFNQAYQVSTNPEYLVQAGDMLEKQGEEVKALNVYRKAVISDPTLLRAQERILDLQLEIAAMNTSNTRAWGDVKETAEAIHNLDETHIRGLHALGAALLALRELSPENEAQGLAYLEQAVQAAPNDLDAVRALATYYVTQERTEDADALIVTLVEGNTTPGEDASKARCILAELRDNAGDSDAADALYEEAGRLSGDDPEIQSFVQVAIGTHWASRWRQKKMAARSSNDEETPNGANQEADFAQAVAAFEKAIAIYPEGFESYLRLAQLYRANDRIADAIAIYKKRNEEEFDRKGLKEMLVRYNRYRILVNLASLHATLAGQEEPGTEAQDRLAREADEFVEYALGEFPSGPEAAQVRGQIQFVLGKYREAVKWLEQAATQRSGPDVQNQLMMAQALINLQEWGRAEEAILKAVAIPSAPASCWITYARIKLELGDAADALSAANQVLARFPDQRDALLIKAAAQERLGQRDVAAEIITNLETSDPRLVVARAHILAEQGQTDEALAQLEAVRSENPTSPLPVEAMMRIYRSLERPADARRVVEEALAANPGSFDLQVLSLQAGDYTDEQRRERYLELVGELDDGYEQAIRLASFYEQQPDILAAAEQYRTAVDLIVKRQTSAARSAGETGLRSIFDRLFQIYAEEEKLAELDTLVELAAEVNLDAADGLSYKGRRLMIDGYLLEQRHRQAQESGNTEEAERLRTEIATAYDEAVEALKLALEQFPSSGHTYAQLGEAYLHVNRIEEARIAFERANEILPRNQIVLKRLAAVAESVGNDVAFKRYLAECERLMPDDPWVIQRRLILEEDVDPRAVIVKREQTRAADPDDVGNLYKLAELYNTVGDIAKAEERIGEVLARHSDARTISSVSRLLRQMGRFDRALQVLQQYLRDCPQEEKASAQLMIGDHLLAIGSSSAENAYLAAADIDANVDVCRSIGQYYVSTRRYPEAKEWLDKGYQLAGAADSLQKATLHRLRIETLLRMEDMAGADALCQAYREAYPDDATGIFMEAQVLRGLGRTEEAIAKLSRFLDMRPGMAIGLFSRAEYLCSLGKWQEAITDLEKLRSSDPAALDYSPRTLLARAFRQIGQPDRAIQELESAYNDAPKVAHVADELITAYLDEERYLDADRVLTTLLSYEPENARWLMRAGDVAVEQQDRSKALAAYRESAKLSGYQSIVTIKLLRACRKDKLNAVEQGISYLEDEIPPDKRTPAVMLAGANLYADRGDVPTAMENYRVAVHRAGYAAAEFHEQTAIAILSNFGVEGGTKLVKELSADAIFERANRHILSDVLRGAGQLEEALTVCHELYESTTDTAERATIDLRIARLQDELEKTEEARAAYERVLAAEGDNLIALNNLAFLLCDKLAKPEEAIQYARRAAQLAGRPEVLDTLGWAYLQAGQLREAIAQLTKARQLDPTYAPATCHLAEACRRVGEFRNAEQLFGEVIAMPADGPHEAYRIEAEEGLQKAQQRSAD